MSDAEDVQCRLCGGRAAVLERAFPGYKAPTRFAILECAYCDVQFAEPPTVDDSVYQDIYLNAATLPGYSRYVRLAASIRGVAEPLDKLAGSEDMYWFVRRALGGLRLDATDLIIEIGSGLGYLTYALREAGYAAVGLDISPSAVLEATKRFGDWYRVADATNLQATDQQSAAVVIMTEVIEHVANPVDLIAAIRNLLRPGGTALITTPNKSTHALGARWETESPPVHLWWFSECAMRRLAQQQGMAISFCDFTDFPSLSPARAARAAPEPRPSLLDEDGATRGAVARAERVKGQIRKVAPAFLCRVRHDMKASKRHRVVGRQRSSAMGVILRKLEV